jgi:hypothetical protein
MGVVAAGRAGTGQLLALTPGERVRCANESPLRSLEAGFRLRSRRREDQPVSSGDAK